MTMIDPRLIRPEAVAPTTDIVAPSPQYYGEGTVRGGQIQLGDVYGQMPSQSQEEYLYGNLASMAQSAMSMFTFPAQMEQAEQQRNNKHDQDKLFEYRAAQAELQQAQLDGKGIFSWGGMEHDISNPELFSALNLQMQESILGNMRTKKGIAEAAEIKTSTLAVRNKDVDGRISELMEEYEQELKRFQTENLPLSDDEFYKALKADTKLTQITSQIASYRDTRSPQMESAIRRMSGVENEAAAASHSYLVTAATKTMVDSVSSLVDTLPDMIPALSTPFGPAAFVRWMGNVPDAENLFGIIGLSKKEDGSWEIASSSLLDSIANRQNPNDIRELVETIILHSSKYVSVFSSDIERESFARRIVSSFDGNIRKMGSTFRQIQISQTEQGRIVGLQLSRNDYVAGGRDSVPEVFANMDQKTSESIIIQGLLNKNNPRTGIDRMNFVLEDSRNAITSNMGTPNIPLELREQRLAKAYFGVDDLVKTGLYEIREDGKMYLSQAGISEQQRKSNGVSRNVFNDPVYMNLIRDELDSIQYDSKYLPSVQPSVESLQRELNKDLLVFVKKNFPVGNTKDKDLLIAMGLEDAPEGYGFPTELSKWIDKPVADMFQGVVQTIFRQYGRSTEASATEAAKIPDAYKPFDTLDRQDVLDDNSIEALYAAGEFNRKMSEATTDEERAKIIRDDYARQPWMTSSMMQNLVAKSRQLDQKTALANYALSRLSKGQLSPDTPINITPLDFTEKSPIQNAAEFWTNANYFNQETGRFTERGAKLFALWSTSFFSGPVSSTQRDGMQQWMDEVVNTELNELNNPTSMLSGSPLLMLAEVITLAESATAGGITSLHQSAVNKYPKEVSFKDPQTGETISIDLSYSPEAIARADNFMSIFGNPSERSTQLQLAFARQIAHQLRGVDGLDRAAVRDLVRRNARIYSGLLTVGTRDSSGQNSDILSTAGPIGMRGDKAYYPQNIADFVTKMQEEIALGNHGSAINGFVSLSNLFVSDKQPPVKVSGDNKAKLTRDILVSSAMWSQSQGHQHYYPIPKRFADSYNEGIADVSFHIKAGDVLPLWSDDGKDIMSILSNMSDEYLDDDTAIWWFGQPLGARSKDSIPEEWDIVDGLLKNLFYGINMPVPGTSRQTLSAIIPPIVTLKQDNILDFPKNDSVVDRMGAFFRYNSFVDGYNNVGGYLPTMYQDYSGTRLSSTERRTLPPEYHYQGSPINLGWGNQLKIENFDGEIAPLFASKGNEIAAQFLLASPRTSKDRAAFAKAREDYFIGEIISPNVWNRLNVSAKDQIVALAKGNTNNIDFFRAASNIAKDYLPLNSFFPPDFDGLVYNNANLNEQQYMAGWRQSGYFLMEDRRNTQSGFQLNKNGHILIGQNGRPSTRIPLSPTIIRLVDPSALGKELIIPEKERETGTKDFGGGAGDRSRTAVRQISQANNRGPTGMLAGAAQALGMAAMGSLPPSNVITTEVIGSEGFNSSPKKVDRNGKFFTVGHGHLLDGSKRSREAFKETFPDKNYDEFMSGRGTLTKQEASLLLEKDMPTYIERAKKFTDSYGGLKFKDHTEELQVQLISATYRGSWGLSPKARRLLSQGKYEEAANEFLNNKEYRDAATDTRITGIRARMEKVANAIRTEGERKKKLEEEKKKKEQAEKTK
jgi:hypothetical protein